MKIFVGRAQLAVSAAATLDIFCVPYLLGSALRVRSPKECPGRIPRLPLAAAFSLSLRYAKGIILSLYLSLAPQEERMKKTGKRI